MKPNYNAIRLIEKHIDGSISLLEQDWLRQRLVVDPSLREELHLRKELESITDETEVDFLRQKLAVAWQENDAFQTSHTASLNRFSRLKKYLYAAATLSGLAAGGLGLHTVLKPADTSNVLFAQHFEAYPPVRVVRSGNQISSESQFFRGMIAYQSGYYNTSVDDFESLVRSGDTSTTVKFYLGVSYMELGRFGEARQTLGDVTNSGSLFVEQSVWYTALCYLAEGNSSKAKILLESLSSSETSMAGKAEALLQKLPE